MPCQYKGKIHLEGEDYCKIHARLNDNSQEECPICYERMRTDSGDDVCKLGCAHRFHTKCLRPWLERRQVSCPMCRRNIDERQVHAIAPNVPQLEPFGFLIMDNLNVIHTLEDAASFHAMRAVVEAQARAHYEPLNVTLYAPFRLTLRY